MYYTCPRRLGTIRSSLARGMRHRHMIILKSVTFTMTTESPPRAPPRGVFCIGFKMLIPTPGSRRRGSAQTRASRRTRSGTVADSEEERSALPTAGTWPAIEAGHRDSLLYSGGKNPRDSAATQASAHHHTHHIEADGTHTSKQDTAAQHTRTASHTTPSSPKLPGGSPAPQSVVALHSMRSGSKEAGSAAGP